MKKFHLLVLDSNREKLLRELQLFRNVQFDDVRSIENFEDESMARFKRPDIDDKVAEIEDKISQCSSIIDLVSKYTPTVSTFRGLIDGLPNYTFEQMEEEVGKFDFEKEYNDIKALGDELSKIESSISKKRSLMDELKPISQLDVSFDEMSNLSRFVSFVGTIPNKVYSKFSEDISKVEGVYLERLGIFKDDIYVFMIYDKRVEQDLNEVLRDSNLNKIKLEGDLLPKDKIELLKEEIGTLDSRKREIINVLSEKNESLDYFKLKYEYLGNLRVRELAKKEFMVTSSVCVISGYCPDFDVDRLEKTVSNISGSEFVMEFEDVDKDSEDVPIMLKNNKLVKAFENVTSTYALPKYNEIDPTPLYAPIYALFFGMMSADFGYGVILLLVTTLGLRICNFTPSMRQNVKFFQLIGVSTMLWGFLYGSYFGKSIPGVWQLFDMSTQFMNILIMSIAMGGIHLFYGLGIKAYMLARDGRYADMFFDVIAWYISLISIISLLLSLANVLPSSFKAVSTYGMYAGLLLLLIGGGRGSEGGIFKKFAAGMYNIYGISGYVGDFVSYSRLMALGMAGGYISFSVNMIAGMLWGSGIIGIIGAIIVLVIFHLFNLFLSCLGAYVHSLRLIYVEFFGKFYEGGGKGFKVFRNKAKFINLDREFED
ncbi:V-type ATP synthase subunit I [Peptostreptococcus faecalis]|uniref:V-type ATP synthase subunit I n=1 Tax=Peptostreptococcus faecalis TaxID=2045015 RepID=UPI001FA84C44|nr:V-type ATP synthase subunit I [Peptostreptococcus faecalis]